MLLRLRHRFELKEKSFAVLCVLCLPAAVFVFTGVSVVVDVFVCVRLAGDGNREVKVEIVVAVFDGAERLNGFVDLAGCLADRVFNFIFEAL